MRLKLLLASALLFTAFAAIPAAGEDQPAIAEAGRVIFEHRCRICHADDPELKTYGPPLVGVVGRKAGSFPGYTYSEALKSANIVWTDGAIKAWMANNKEMMPGTKMRHVGITDPAEQDLILAYLKTLAK